MVLKFKNQEEWIKGKKILQEHGIETEVMGSYSAWLSDEVTCRMDCILSGERKEYYDNLDKNEQKRMIKEVSGILTDTGNFIDYDQLDNDLEEAIDLFRKGVDGNMESTENCIPV